VQVTSGNTGLTFRLYQVFHYCSAATFFQTTSSPKLNKKFAKAAYYIRRIIKSFWYICLILQSVTIYFQTGFFFVVVLLFCIFFTLILSYQSSF